jgi:GxxExxY protein
MLTTKDTKASADRLSYDIVGAAIEVHRQLGPGLLESAYEACICREFSFRGIEFDRQVSLPLRYRDMVVECGYRLDSVVGGLVIVEVKSVSKVLPNDRTFVSFVVTLPGAICACTLPRGSVTLKADFV